MRNLRAKLAVGLLVLAPVITAAQTNADEVLLFTYFRNHAQHGTLFVAPGQAVGWLTKLSATSPESNTQTK